MRSKPDVKLERVRPLILRLGVLSGFGGGPLRQPLRDTAVLWTSTTSPRKPAVFARKVAWYA